MQDSFLSHVEDFENWRNSGYPDVKLETREFIDNLLRPDKKWTMWNHQLEGLLRTIYAYEVLGKKNCLLNIVTGGGKTAIIGAVNLPATMFMAIIEPADNSSRKTN